MEGANTKILELDQLAAILEKARADGKTIVQCHGVFDILHVGHIRYLQHARQLGDVLVVTLTADQFVNKGPGRPAFPDTKRAEVLAALECVSYVAINNAESAVPAIQALRPNVYVKGADYKDRPRTSGGNLAKEEEAVRACGGRLAYTDDELHSSSALINAFGTTLPKELREYFSKLRSTIFSDDIEALFRKVAGCRVLVIGETIVDEYDYVEAIGKAGKEPVLVTKHRSSERFAGGAVAVANNVAGFCDSVTLFSALGGINSQESFVRSALKPNVKGIFVHQEQRPTIVKRRHVDHYLLQKLFEVYVIDDDVLTEAEDAAIQSNLRKLLPDFDLVIVADYGHGMLSLTSREIICSQARFLAVNTQANAGNRGYHLISHYPRADYISLSFGELCLEMRRRHGDINEMLPILLDRVRCDRVTITKGKEGIVSWSRQHGLSTAPAMTQHFVDRVGSGDAVLAVTSPLAACGADPTTIAFLGNLAGAEAVRTVGHRTSLTRGSLLKPIKSILK